MFLHELVIFIFFFLKAIILVAAILVLVGGLLALIAKNKLRETEKIKIKPLNKHYEALEETIQAEVLSKEEKKQLNKEIKAKNKQKNHSLPENSKRLFILNFNGDMKASQVQSLREEITAILTVARPGDTVLLKLESMGGMVHGYGLAASELLRIKDRAIPLVISVDKVAASGGYMMACVANQIIAAPFAILGSIGVVAQLPNVNQLLKKHHIDYEMITAGEYKRTLTVFGQNTEEGRRKVQDEVNDTHELFKEFIRQHRPQIDIATVATGEHWFATRALKLNLVDQLITSDDYLTRARKDMKLFEVTYKKPKKILEKLSEKIRVFFRETLSTL